MNTKQKAEKFQQMHKNGFFTLANVWNGGSAKIFEKEGFKALGTTSAGIAYSKGVADGERISFNTLLNVVSEITEVTHIPLSVDFERGYSDDIQEITKNMEQLLKAGAVGCNIEDGVPEENRLDDLAFQCEKIKALSYLKKELDIPFVINARTCGAWLNIYSKKEYHHIVERCNAFVNAGADCVFIPGVLDYDSVAYFRKQINAPINIIANPKISISELKSLKIERLSIGSGAVRTTLAKTIEVAKEISNNENLEPMFAHTFSYALANQYFE